MCSSDLLQYSAGYVVPSSGLEIEIGGRNPGNSGQGNDIDGYDQIQVTGGSANLAGGALDVRLVNGFVPNIGDRFNFLQLNTSNPVNTLFPNATGLFSFPAGDRYFDIVSDGSGGLTLEVKGFLNGLSLQPAAAALDSVGTFLGTYFTSPTMSWTGDLTVAG